MKQQTRLNKLTKPAMQIRLVGAFLLAALLSVVIQAAVLNRVMVTLATKLPTDEQVLLNEWPSLLRNGMLSTALISVVLILGVGVLATHRIAGAVHRLESFLRDVAEGREAAPCTLRAKDQLHELSALINNATEGARETNAASAAPTEKGEDRAAA